MLVLKNGLRNEILRYRKEFNMDRILNVLIKTLKIYKDPPPKNDFEEGQVDGIITARNAVRLKIDEIHREKLALSVIGVCGLCGQQHPSYKDATECCNHLKGKGYEQEINQVFQVRKGSQL